MVMNYKNARWSNVEKTAINMTVRLDASIRSHWTDGEWVPFTASPDDYEDYGRALFATAVKEGGIEEPHSLTSEELRAAMRPLSPREFRDALIDNDIMPDQVTAAINQMEDPKARAKALNAWEYPAEFTRNDPLVDQIGTIFGLTPEMIDKLWTEAS